MINRRTARRAAYTLIEVVAAAGIMGLVATLAVSSVRLASLGNYGADADTRKLAMVLHDARRRAIASGDNHLVKWRTAGRKILGYGVYRRRGRRLEQIDEDFFFSRDVRVSVSPRRRMPEFRFEGDAVRSFTIRIRSRERRWKLTLVQAGGGILVTRER